jgi:two-component system response regulator FlrC
MIARAMVEGLPGTGTVLICNAGSPAQARRGDDLLIVLERSEHEAVERIGANQVRIAYADPTSPAPLAAIIAAAGPRGGPILADPASLANVALAERLARSDIPVLIGGPTGTGKEVLSRFIHRASPRADQPFVAINCAAMPEAMLEAMLFGHRKGAFTGASEAAEGFFRAADGGTLLLDEIAEMPLALQAKLLRALQEGEVVPLGATKPVKVDVRIIACANRDLAQEVAERRFRADLFYRLNVFPLSLSALRERPDDIAPLAFALALRHSPPVRPLWLGAGALAKLRQHAWPGNVRELENVIRRALLLAGDASEIGAGDIVFDHAVRVVPAAPAADAAPVYELPRAAGRLSAIVREIEAEAIIEALREFDGNRLATARRLGISERTLRYRLADMREAGIAIAGGAR